MLVVIGVTTNNQKTFLTIQKGDKESASTWREVFKDLKKRGLNPSTVELGIMDGLSGLRVAECGWRSAGGGVRPETWVTFQTGQIGNTF